eukprot:TRINITY_DN27763_c0_g1_i1.p1 TRINITY_DN27763_c0_g1~~TRINITY_DN27763_c0_g1_i1.p1  ORF type:complete len:406 (+),score=48.02 TRINITY_DN27763_c0_g1_i1:114-1220(+)
MVLEVSFDSAFMTPKLGLRHGGMLAGSLRPAAPRSVVMSSSSAQTSKGSFGSSSSFGLASAGIAAAFALLWRRDRQSRVSRNSFAIANPNKGGGRMWERKNWTMVETRDPTSLPIWQRDFRYGYQVLIRSMHEARAKGKKVFWDVRVREVKELWCEIEMMNSGILGRIPRSQEGLPKGERLKQGEVYRVECTACPTKRVIKEPKRSVWPKLEETAEKALPMFSHFNYHQYCRNKAFAQELEAGTIIKGKVYKYSPRGAVIALDTERYPERDLRYQPKGFISIPDMSRFTSHMVWFRRMFRLGTEMPFYLVHADKNYGRITLSLKEFEDDDHVGEMHYFPERIFEKAEEVIEKYHKKRDDYIRWLQKEK